MCSYNITLSDTLVEIGGGEHRQQFTIDTHEATGHRQEPHQRTQENGLARALRPRDTGDLTILGNEGESPCQSTLTSGYRRVFYL